LRYDEEELFEAITYQKLRIPNFKNSHVKIWDFEFNFPEFFERRLSNSPVKLNRTSQQLQVEQPLYLDRKDYARQVILWGRKSGLIERLASWKQHSLLNKFVSAK
jgi:hypothetical protein